METCRLAIELGVFVKLNCASSMKRKHNNYAASSKLFIKADRKLEKQGMKLTSFSKIIVDLLTSSPASSYKDSSSVACNNRRAQYWLTGAPSSFAITFIDQIKSQQNKSNQEVQKSKLVSRTIIDAGASVSILSTTKSAHFMTPIHFEPDLDSYFGFKIPKERSIIFWQPKGVEESL
ncbi:hypothetical protein LXL04_026709 [Taraxacum kok-saghyz]